MRRLETVLCIASLVGSVVQAGCAGSNDASHAPPAELAGDRAVPVAGASIALDATALVAWVADADNHALHRVDLGTEEVTTTSLPGAPEQVALVRRGGTTTLFVTLRDIDEVAAIEIDATGAVSIAARAAVAADPVGLAWSPRGELLVTSGLGHTLTSLDARSLKERWSVDLAREPRSVVIAPDGTRAFVTHLVGDAVSVVDLDRSLPRVRSLHVLGGRHRDRVDRAIGAGTLHPASSLAWAAAINEATTRLFVPHIALQNGSDTPRSIPGAYGGVPVEEDTTFASVAVVSVRGERLVGDAGPAPEGLRSAAPLASESVGFAVAPAGAPTRQVRGAAVVGDVLLVASFGTDELCALDARALDPAMSEARCHRVGSGPTGVAVDPATRIAVTWNQHSHDVSVVDLDSASVEHIPVASDPLDPDVAAGRRLFVTERDRRITRDGRACSACHPEGRDDGLVWKLGQGPRQTPTLVGRTERGPFGWLGKHAILEDNLRETIGRLGGTGLPERELSQLAAYLKRGLVVRARRGERVDPALAERGRAIFTSPETGCTSCHVLEREGSDRAVHDVGSRSKTDATAGFRTPPLVYVGSTAPYFHDGRYATLEQLLADNLDRMGTTSHLSPSDLAALAAFLRTL